MINKFELRLGNFVGIDPGDYREFKRIKKGWDIEDLKETNVPLPINEFWKKRFNISYKSTPLDFGGFKIEIGIDALIVEFVALKEPGSVHELQNFYFFQTGEELWPNT